MKKVRMIWNRHSHEQVLNLSHMILLGSKDELLKVHVPQKRRPGADPYIFYREVDAAFQSDLSLL